MTPQEARVTVSTGSSHYRLEGSLRDDGMATFDIVLRRQGEDEEQVIGGLSVAAPDLSLVRAALDRLLRDLDPFKPKAYSLDSIRKDHPAAYARWTTEEEQRLLQEFESGHTVEELTKLLGCQPSAIRSRLRRLGRLEE